MIHSIKGVSSVWHCESNTDKVIAILLGLILTLATTFMSLALYAEYWWMNPPSEIFNDPVPFIDEIIVDEITGEIDVIHLEQITPGTEVAMFFDQNKHTDAAWKSTTWFLPCGTDTSEFGWEAHAQSLRSVSGNGSPPGPYKGPNQPREWPLLNISNDPFPPGHYFIRARLTFPMEFLFFGVTRDVVFNSQCIEVVSPE